LFFEWKYKKVGEAIGAGAFGLVYKVVKRGDESGQLFAAKVGRRGHHDMENEYEIMKKLDHPNIAQEYDFF
jgi:serine/threonine protein kinase